MEEINKKEIEREKRLYFKLPLLIREIIYDALLPLPSSKNFVEEEIKEIKKIVNAECKSALELLKEINSAFMK